MSPKKDESFESWAERARLFETGWALQRIAKGDDPNIVLEDFARRLSEKIMHPLYKEIKDSIIQKFDPEKSRKDYEEKYLKNRQPVADHVDDELFDNSEKK
jgi:glutamyl-tRNA reductase